MDPVSKKLNKEICTQAIEECQKKPGHRINVSVNLYLKHM